MAILDELFGPGVGQPMPADPFNAEALLRAIQERLAGNSGVLSSVAPTPERQPSSPIPTVEVKPRPQPGVPYGYVPAVTGSYEPTAGRVPSAAPQTAPAAPARMTQPADDRGIGDRLNDAFAALQGQDTQRRRETENLTAKALVAKGIDPDLARAITRNQALANAVLPAVLGPKSVTFGVIGEDQYGNKRYGFINPQTQTTTPAQPAAAVSGADLPTGEAYLKTLDKPMADQVRALSEGRMAFPSGFALKSPYWQRMLQMVGQYDPGFDAVNYNARNKTRADFTAGKSAQNITAFNTALQHLDTLDKAIEPLNNTNVPSWNRFIANPLASQLSPEYQIAMKKFEAARTAVADELTRAFRGAGGNVHDIVQWEKTINAADSPQALHAAVKQAVELLNGRIESVADQYNRGMGTTRDAVELLSPKAQQTIKRLMGSEAPPTARTKPVIAGEGIGTSKVDSEEALSQARAAIAAGKDPEAIKARLKQLGVDPTGL